ncbi:mucin-15 [Trichomycterus rosablanca]|uniref:mucin-15 n=1 Tax=Trichomycterus rosablanca TaxID=2290929 RepID=UPI002F35D7B1
MKLTLGFSIALLLSLQHVSAQSSSPVTAMPDTDVNVTMALEEDLGASSGSGIELNSGDDAQNQTSSVSLVTGKPNDENVTVTSLPFVPLNSNEIHETSDDNVSSSVTPTPTPNLGPSAPNKTDLNNTNSTNVPSEMTSNDTTPVTFTGNVTTTRSPQVANSTKPPNVNATNTTLPATTMLPTNENSTEKTVPATTMLPTNENSTERTFPTAEVPYNDNFTNVTAPAEFVTEMNRTGGSFNVRGDTDRGLSSATNDHHKNQAWGAFLGFTIAVSIVAMVIYVIQKRRGYRDFSHRKLVEDAPQDPVLRLDNSEPLDLKLGGFAYYNPGQQGDNIRMTNFPRGQYN